MGNEWSVGFRLGELDTSTNAVLISWQTMSNLGRRGWMVRTNCLSWLVGKTVLTTTSERVDVEGPRGRIGKTSLSQRMGLQKVPTSHR